MLQLFRPGRFLDVLSLEVPDEYTFLLPHQKCKVARVNSVKCQRTLDKNNLAASEKLKIFILTWSSVGHNIIPQIYNRKSNEEFYFKGRLPNMERSQESKVGCEFHHESFKCKLSVYTTGTKLAVINR